MFQFGKFYRLQSADDFFATAWLFTNDEEAIVIYFNGLARPAVPVKYVKTRYLEEQAIFKNTATGTLVSGAELNQAGITIPRIKEDFSTLLFHWKKI